MLFFYVRAQILNVSHWHTTGSNNTSSTGWNSLYEITASLSTKIEVQLSFFPVPNRNPIEMNYTICVSLKKRARIHREKWLAKVVEDNSKEK